MNEAKFKMIRTLIAVGDFREALIQLNKVPVTDPDNYQAFNLLGVIYEMGGNEKDAIIMYNTALSLNPGYRPAQHNLGRLSHNSGNLTDPDLGGDWFHNFKSYPLKNGPETR